MGREHSAVTPETDPISERLEKDQISWYDRKSLFNQRMFKRIKVIEILAAAVIPFIAALKPPHIAWVTGALGVLITVLEGMLHLNQYYQQELDCISFNLRVFKAREIHLFGEGFALRECSRSPRFVGREDRVAGLAGTREVGLGAAAGEQTETRCRIVGAIRDESFRSD